MNEVNQAEMARKRDFGDRLSSLLREKGLSQAALARQTGESSSSISAYVKGERFPHVEAAIKLAESLEVSVQELIVGRAPESAAYGVTSKGTFTVPMLGLKLSAGGGALALDENVIGHMPIPSQVMQQLGRSDTKGLYAMQLRGDSMFPTISDEAWAIVDTFDDELADGIFAYRYGTDLAIKRLQVYGLGDIEIRSDNPRYGTERVYGDKRDEFKIIGRAIWAATLL